MDNAHLIGITGTKFDNKEDEEKYDKWANGAYGPMLLNTTLMGINRCLVLEEEPEYPKYITLNCTKNLEGFLTYAHSTERDAYYKDIRATWGNKMERPWQVVYQIAKRFENGSDALNEGKENADRNAVQEKEYTSENAPIIQLKGLSLSAGDWEKYDAWVNEWGYDVYIPMLLKVPGVTEYSRCWLSNVGWFGAPPKPGVSEDPKYPQDLSIIYFENVKAYQNFRKSKELAAFEKNLAAEFPGGLSYKWDVACRLFRRWTK